MNVEQRQVAVDLWHQVNRLGPLVLLAASTHTHRRRLLLSPSPKADTQFPSHTVDPVRTH